MVYFLPGNNINNRSDNNNDYNNYVMIRNLLARDD